jgi:hypothetical protein
VNPGRVNDEKIRKDFRIVNSGGMNYQKNPKSFRMVNPERVNYEKNPLGFFEWNSGIQGLPSRGGLPEISQLKIF